jgi:hypothetical protein
MSYLLLWTNGRRQDETTGPSDIVPILFECVAGCDVLSIRRSRMFRFVTRMRPVTVPLFEFDGGSKKNPQRFLRVFHWGSPHAVPAGLDERALASPPSRVVLNNSQPFSVTRALTRTMTRLIRGVAVFDIAARTFNLNEDRWVLRLAA